MPNWQRKNYHLVNIVIIQVLVPEELLRRLAGEFICLVKHNQTQLLEPSSRM